MEKWTEKTLKAYQEAMTAEEPLPDSTTTTGLVGGFAAALGIKAAARTYAQPDWEAVDPGIQSHFREAHEELELLRLSLFRLADEMQVQMDAVRSLTLPLSISEQCLAVLEHLQEITTCAAGVSLTDVGTGSSLALAALDGALLCVRKRLSAISEKDKRAEWMEQAERMWERGVEIKEETMAALFIRMSVE